MYTDKKNILQLAALLRTHGIKHIVLCPGSRDIPLVQTLANVSDFRCYPITDERSAGFFAIGMSLQSGSPTAVVCTSGSALLNLHPAVAEAFYQKVPLVVISADRPGAWIGQMDGQTFPQPNVFQSLVKRSVNLPEIQNEEDEWFCNRLINEALLELNHHGKGPVHINVPVSDPFFQYPVTELPQVRTITRHIQWNKRLAEELKQCRKRMIVVGQTPSAPSHPYINEAWSEHFVWLAENLANNAVPSTAIRRFDTLLYAAEEDLKESLRPELLITYGGHIVSKRLKQFLRKHPPRMHWHVAPDGNVVDLYGCVTTLIEMEPTDFLKHLSQADYETDSFYLSAWEKSEQHIPEPQFGFSEMEAIGRVIKHLPSPAVLHLANSSIVRYAQLFSLPTGIDVCSNRGINGIEGSISTAIGYASVSSERLNFIVTGDLSFFYDGNALWNSNYGKNVRILLLNNDGGEIFHALPGLHLKEDVQRFVVAPHHFTAKHQAAHFGLEYLTAHNDAELTKALQKFLSPESAPRPMLLEVFTDKSADIRELKAYYQSIYQKFNKQI